MDLLLNSHIYLYLTVFICALPLGKIVLLDDRALDQTLKPPALKKGSFQGLKTDDGFRATRNATPCFFYTLISDPFSPPGKYWYMWTCFKTRVSTRNPFFSDKPMAHMSVCLSGLRPRSLIETRLFKIFKIFNHSNLTRLHISKAKNSVLLRFLLHIIVILHYHARLLSYLTTKSKTMWHGKMVSGETMQT